jgi:hypothetical protein
MKFVKVSEELPWIPEPSTVNNKLKCREGSGIQGSEEFEFSKFELTGINYCKNSVKSRGNWI